MVTANEFVFSLLTVIDIALSTQLTNEIFCFMIVTMDNDDDDDFDVPYSSV